MLFKIENSIRGTLHIILLFSSFYGVFYFFGDSYMESKIFGDATFIVGFVGSAVILYNLTKFIAYKFVALFDKSK